VLTFVLTILGGVLIFVIGQIALRVCVEPLQQLRSAIADVIFVLHYYAPTYTNQAKDRPNQLNERAEDAIREKAGILFSRAQAIACYGIFATVKLVPTYNNVEEAVRDLTFIGNNIRSGEPKDNEAARDKIQQSLGISIKPTQQAASPVRTTSTG
jgi:hypothetical protein